MDFWRTKTLNEMTDDEWESLCDGCGKCCLHKIEDEDSGEIFFTRVACRLLDIDSARCTQYSERFHLVSNCLSLRHANYLLSWLPSSCAYRLLAENKDLPAWHPLRTGDPASVHLAGISVREFGIAETPDTDPADFVIEDFE
ncbi:YcgN family cysteine cluster protein [Methylococcus sp. EFPC2]|uniref:YcgN family cysteine cluster protein n=1 Tax=Methylococcus sp. EFPC2 TaxID=2812648 RepID=UPI00196837E3|nr:YcgN family cysteine cluster protein [Methylococcus sp. EFPC2]QSA99121.1 YcgN family cysteine cluster protein [Methylococcus sp. EFPC2]